MDDQASINAFLAKAGLAGPKKAVAVAKKENAVLSTKVAATTKHGITENAVLSGKESATTKQRKAENAGLSVKESATTVKGNNENAVLSQVSATSKEIAKSVDHSQDSTHAQDGLSGSEYDYESSIEIITHKPIDRSIPSRAVSKAVDVKACADVESKASEKVTGK